QLAPVLQDPWRRPNVLVRALPPSRTPMSTRRLVNIRATSERDDFSVGRKFGSPHKVHWPAWQKSVLEAVAPPFWPESLFFDCARNVRLTIGKLGKDCLWITLEVL